MPNTGRVWIVDASRASSIETYKGHNTARVWIVVISSSSAVFLNLFGLATQNVGL